jgi:hypothetical protein
LGNKIRACNAMKTKEISLYNVERIKSMLEHYKEKLENEDISRNNTIIDTLEDLIGIL